MSEVRVAIARPVDDDGDTSSFADDLASRLTRSPA
jgi:hypothetical protein